MRRLSPRIALESEELASAEISVADAVATADAPAEVPAEAAPVVAAAATGAVEPTVVLDAAAATNDAPSLQPEAINPEEVVINAEPESPEVEAETELMDTVEQDQAKIETLAVQVEEAGNVVKALEELCEVLGGVEPVSEQTAKVIHISTQQLLGQVGFTEADAQVVPALESFRGDAAKASSQIALETLEKKVAAIWQTIIQAIQRAVAWVKESVRKLFDMSIQVSKRAEELKKEIGPIANKKPKATQFLNPTLWVDLQVERKFPQNLAAEAVKTCEIVERQFTRYNTDEFTNPEVLKNLEADSESFVYRPQIEISKSGLTGKTSKTTPGVNGAAGGTYYVSDMMLGGFCIGQFIGPESTGRDAVRWLIDTPSLFKAGNMARLNTEEVHDMRLTCPVASPSELKACLEQAKAMADGVAKFRATVAKLEKAAETLVKHAQKSMTPVTAEDEAAQTRAWVMKQYLTAAPRWLVHEPSELANFTLNKSRSIIRYVELCLDQYRPKAA